MTDLKPYYQVELTLLRCKTYFLYNPPKTEDEKNAYDIIQKAYCLFFMISHLFHSIFPIL